MRLLDKKDVNEEKGRERLIEIQEGAKLAKKVDDLRQMYASEEVNLKKFHDESLDRVKKDIAEALAEKQNILKEVEALREERLKIKQLLEEYVNSSTTKYD